MIPAQDERGSEQALQLLGAMSIAMLRQRAALVAGNTCAINSQFEALLELMPGLTALTVSAGGARSGPEDAAIAALARRLREQLSINQALIRNGIAAADHYAATAAAAAAAAQHALFSGVG
jgi:hypothetical protein